MGSKGSHMISSESPQPSSRKSSPGPRRSLINRGRLKLSSLFCGAFNPQSTLEAEEDCPEKLSSSCSRKDSNSTNFHQNPSLDPSSIFSSEAGEISSIHEDPDSSGRNSSNIEDTSVESGVIDNQHFQESVPGDSGDFPARETPCVTGVNDQSQRELNDIEIENDRAYYPPIASNLEFPVSESERNVRNTFWDAFTRRSFTRHGDSTSSLVHNFDNEPSFDPDALFDTNLRRNARRLLLRTEISDRAIGGLNEGRQRGALCPSGLHGDGTCYCSALFTDEESRNLASISRIILLAEALFEVLDEIHHQSLSLSLSSLAVPAPGPVVDSFPIKHHRNNKNPDDVQQCYVCLADYEEGDELRVLPCNHGYHRPCIDRWLKEVNRVCPLCRRNVCDDSAVCT